MANDSQKRLLVVEDDPGLQKQMKWAFEGWEVHVCGDRETALDAFDKNQPQVVTLDLGLPPDPGGISEGMATLQALVDRQGQAKIIVMTGNDAREHAVKAVALGAYDFYSKPVDFDVLRIIVERAYHLSMLEEENRRLLQQSQGGAWHGIISASRQMEAICRTIEKVAATDVTILLQGESGTGKELLARALHDLSLRAGKSFVAINSAAIPGELLESELFGHEKGAFTGAVRQVRGKIEYANGGTLFLDEIGDLPFSLQAKLLRFMQERVIERVGGRQEIDVDVRVVCATHQNLQVLVREGRFREDLYYRLSEIVIEAPPLRTRSGDAVLLARYFFDKYAAQFKSKVRGFSDEALRAIDAYAWPGNVRELENRVKRAVLMEEAPRIGVASLDLVAVDTADKVETLKTVRERAEVEALIRALSLSGGSVSKAAEMLDITRPTLYSLLGKLGLKQDSW
ncbi:MAG: PEP-CTERM-box response regulator transcription factor [Gammaproteobacteria bacterium]|nr:PEP-CTERM-box response regulator transcription factor [Gammaproteobacteria bacterium]